jgi:hypothetical protein
MSRSWCGSCANSPMQSLKVSLVPLGPRTKRNYSSTSLHPATITSYTPASSSPTFPASTGALLIESVGFVVNKAPQPGLPQPSDLPLEANLYRSKATWLGLGDNKHIHSVEYSLPAERRLGGASAPVCVSCNIIAEWTCVDGYFRLIRAFGSGHSAAREPGSPIRTG